MAQKKSTILLLLAALNFTHILDFMIMMPLGNYLMPYFKINPQQFSYLVGAYTLSAAASGFAAAFFVDGFDRKRVLLVGYIGFLIGTIACGIAPTYWLLLFARIFAGLFGGLIGAQVLSIIADIFPYEERGKAMGAIMSAFAVASTLGVPFALYLANLISWHAPFLLVGILGVALVPMLMKFIPKMNQHTFDRAERNSKFDALINVATNPHLRMALLFTGLMMMGHFLVIPFINPYLEFNNGYSKVQTPMIYLVGGLASFFSATILGRISDQYGKLNVFAICSLLCLPLVIGVTHVPAIPFWIVLVLFAIWFVVSTGRSITAQAMVSNVIPPQQRGSFMSFNSSVQQLGTSAASFIAGLVVIRGEGQKIVHYNWLGYLSVIVLLICYFLGKKLFANMDQIHKTTA